jgi:hypothetical protein
MHLKQDNHQPKVLNSAPCVDGTPHCMREASRQVKQYSTAVDACKHTTKQHHNPNADLDGSAHILASWPAVLRHSPLIPSLPAGQQLFHELPQSHMTPSLRPE